MALKSRKALLVQGALTSVLLPILAQDAKVDLSTMLEGVNAANFKESKPQLITALQAATKGKLAQDASLDAVVDLLDKLDDVTDGAESDDVAESQPAADAEEDPMAKLMAFCKGKMGEDDFNELSSLMSGEGASDEETPEAPEGGAPKPGKDGQAMDAATIVRRVQAIASAKELVEPIVGKITVAHDSAKPILALAMDHLKLDKTGLNETGMRRVLEMHLAAKAKGDNAQGGGGSAKLAMDAATSAQSEFETAFPAASKLIRA